MSDLARSFATPNNGANTLFEMIKFGININSVKKKFEFKLNCI